MLDELNSILLGRGRR